MFPFPKERMQLFVGSHHIWASEEINKLIDQLIKLPFPLEPVCYTFQRPCKLDTFLLLITIPNFGRHSSLDGLKLRSVKPLVRGWTYLCRYCRRREVILRTDHTNLTHVYLMAREKPQACPFCRSFVLLSVYHLRM